MAEKNDLPWDLRPVTARDVAITAGVAVITILVGGILIFLALRTPQASAEVPPAIVQPEATQSVVVSAQASAGGEIFQQKCASCHTIGGGPLVGPDLQGVTGVREEDWLLEWLQVPDQMLAREDPIAVQLLSEFNNIAMPNLGLSEADASAILAFITSESGSPAPAVEPPPVVPEGDPLQGELLFKGEKSLQNNGPACMGCHNISGIGELGGGTLGPSLTKVFDRYGEPGLVAALEGLPFPSMRGVFIDRPLSDEEVAHLLAFFVQANESPEEQTNQSFVGIGLAGFAFMFLLSQIVWKKRLRAVRKPLVGRQL